MKKALALVFGFSMACVAGCGLFTKQNLHTALDIANVLCIVANAELPDENVQKVCNVADALIPDMKKLIGEQRASSRKFAASAGASKVAGDAGCK